MGHGHSTPTNSDANCMATACDGGCLPPEGSGGAKHRARWSTVVSVLVREFSPEICWAGRPTSARFFSWHGWSKNCGGGSSIIDEHPLCRKLLTLFFPIAIWLVCHLVSVGQREREGEFSLFQHAKACTSGAPWIKVQFSFLHQENDFFVGNHIETSHAVNKVIEHPFQKRWNPWILCLRHWLHFVNWFSISQCHDVGICFGRFITAVTPCNSSDKTWPRQGTTKKEIVSKSLKPYIHHLEQWTRYNQVTHDFHCFISAGRASRHWSLMSSFTDPKL